MANQRETQLLEELNKLELEEAERIRLLKRKEEESQAFEHYI